MVQCRLSDLARSSIFDQSRLSTLAMASQSPVALNRLIDSGLLTALCQTLCQFANQEMSKYLASLLGGAAAAERMTDACKSASTSPRSRTQSETSQPITDVDDGTWVVSAKQAADVLSFLAAIAHDACVKDWLGAPNHCAFWSVLLNVLCTSTPPQLASAAALRSSHSAQVGIHLSYHSRLSGLHRTLLA